MIIPPILLKKIVTRHGAWISYIKYQRALPKRINAVCRTDFLKSCLANDVIPNFLSLRIPENGCFEQTKVHTFQKKHLRREFSRVVSDIKIAEDQLEALRAALRKLCPADVIQSVIFQSRLVIKQHFQSTRSRHSDKLKVLSDHQEKPLRGTSQV